jgi:hypothetical protein
MTATRNLINRRCHLLASARAVTPLLRLRICFVDGVVRDWWLDLCCARVVEIPSILMRDSAIGAACPWADLAWSGRERKQ